MISHTEVITGGKERYFWAFFLLIWHQELASGEKGHYQKEKALEHPLPLSFPQRHQLHGQPVPTVLWHQNILHD